MKTFKNYITTNLEEAAYQGNIGFQEMAQFYKIATDAQIKMMEAIIKAENWEGFKKLIYKVIGTKLK